jgi:hypothetical protein
MRGGDKGEGDNLPILYTRSLFLYSPPPPISSPLIWGGIEGDSTPSYILPPYMGRKRDSLSL